MWQPIEPDHLWTMRKFKTSCLGKNKQTTRDNHLKIDRNSTTNHLTLENKSTEHLWQSDDCHINQFPQSEGNQTVAQTLTLCTKTNSNCYNIKHRKLH